MKNYKDTPESFTYAFMHFKNMVLQVNPYEGMVFFMLQRFFGGSYSSRKFIPYNYYEFGVAAGKSARNYMKGLQWFSRY